MDIAVPNMNGLEVTQAIKKRFPDIQILLPTVHDDEEYLFRALQVGPLGFVGNSLTPRRRKLSRVP